MWAARIQLADEKCIPICHNNTLTQCMIKNSGHKATKIIKRHATAANEVSILQDLPQGKRPSCSQKPPTPMFTEELAAPIAPMSTAFPCHSHSNDVSLNKDLQVPMQSICDFELPGPSDLDH